MSTAYARRIRAQGSERFLKVGGRLFTFHHMANGKGRELSEVLDAKEGTISVFPGFWRGQRHYGFAILANAAHDRQSAMRERDSFRRRHFISRAFQAIDASRDFGRPQLDPAQPWAWMRAA